MRSGCNALRLEDSGTDGELMVFGATQDLRFFLGIFHERK